MANTQQSKRHIIHGAVYQALWKQQDSVRILHCYKISSVPSLISEYL